MMADGEDFQRFRGGALHVVHQGVEQLAQVVGVAGEGLGGGEELFAQRLERGEALSRTLGGRRLPWPAQARLDLRG